LGFVAARGANFNFDIHYFDDLLVEYTKKARLEKQAGQQNIRIIFLTKLHPSCQTVKSILRPVLAPWLAYFFAGD
jgi:hypothetical protein